MDINQLTNQPVSDEALKSISDLALMQVSLENEIASLNAKLEEKTEALKRLSDSMIPDAMTAVGMTSFKLKNGMTINVNKFFQASIPKDRTSEAFAWLRKNNFSEIIKREVKCNFGKGEDEFAANVVETLAKMKVQFADKEFVHPMTLKAFVREEIESGRQIPMDLLGVYIGNRAKVTPAT